MKTSNKGFTLIELLVVIAIIGILSSVVLASLNSARQKARDARRIADIKQIQLALELYADSNSGSYPTALSALVTGNQMPVEPKDPSNSATSYNYQPITAAGAVCSAAPCPSYRLGATLSSNANSALVGDADSAAITGTGSFSGLSASAEGTACSATAGTGAAPTGSETCYDVKP